MNWRKSSYSGDNSGNCVEAADNHGRVLIRDSTDSQGPVLRFSPAAWRKFADQVKRSLVSDFRPESVGGTLASWGSLLC